MTERWPVWAAGTMSGTSLDGVDAALLLTDGRDIAGFGAVAYRAYAAPERDLLRAAFGRWEGAADASAVVDAAHAEVLSSLGGTPELVGYHGQTVAHEPAGRGTRQLGDGAWLAEAVGAPVVWDFRSADVAAGGQGAPFASFYHHACARWIGAGGPVVFLNIGGVANLTWVDPRCAEPDAPGACLAFDTGPGNAQLDDAMRRTGQVMDRDGALAAQGRADAGAVRAMLARPYFALPPPKSLDRCDFDDLADRVAGLTPADAAATLTACIVAGVAAGLDRCPGQPARLLVTGGGRHNPGVMAGLARAAACPVDPVEAVGLDGDMLEAQAFAYLAVRVARGLPISAPGTTGVAAPVCGGRLSHPGTAAKAARAG